MKMDTETLFALAKPFLEKNDFGIAHTRRVFKIAEANFVIPLKLQELTFASIILHDIGGSSIKEQYEKGPKTGASILRQLGCDNRFIEEVCRIIGTHHNHPESPSLPFRVLYDSDKLVMFSAEEFPFYNSKAGFDWEKIVALMYSEQAKHLAEELLTKRRKGV
jgi:hypothetical protein